MAAAGLPEGETMFGWGNPHLIDYEDPDAGTVTDFPVGGEITVRPVTRTALALGIRVHNGIIVAYWDGLGWFDILPGRFLRLYPELSEREPGE